MIAKTPKPPYYSVIFTSTNREKDDEYAVTADRMVELAEQQSGFLGFESCSGELNITVSYWHDLASIKQWKEEVEHRQAQQKGRERWYQEFKVRIAKVERDYGFEATTK